MSAILLILLTTYQSLEGLYWIIVQGTNLDFFRVNFGGLQSMGCWKVGCVDLKPYSNFGHEGILPSARSNNSFYSLRPKKKYYKLPTYKRRMLCYTYSTFIVYCNGARISIGIQYGADEFLEGWREKAGLLYPTSYG